MWGSPCAKAAASAEPRAPHTEEKVPTRLLRRSRALREGPGRRAGHISGTGFCVVEGRMRSSAQRRRHHVVPRPSEKGTRIPERGRPAPSGKARLGPGPLPAEWGGHADPAPISALRYPVRARASTRASHTDIGRDARVTWNSSDISFASRGHVSQRCESFMISLNQSSVRSQAKPGVIRSAFFGARGVLDMRDFSAGSTRGHGAPFSLFLHGSPQKTVVHRRMVAHGHGSPNYPCERTGRAALAGAERARAGITRAAIGARGARRRPNAPGDGRAPRSLPTAGARAGTHAGFPAPPVSFPPDSRVFTMYCRERSTPSRTTCLISSSEPFLRVSTNRPWLTLA